MKLHHPSKTSAIVLCGIGLAVAACAALIALWYNRLPHDARVQYAARFSARAGAYEAQKDLIDQYISHALAVHTGYRAHKLTAAQAKQQALALTVPGVLKDRHLAWIIALDKDDAAACDQIMRDYTLLGAAK